MPLDPAAPPATTLGERHADKDASTQTRLRRLEWDRDRGRALLYDSGYTSGALGSIDTGSAGFSTAYLHLRIELVLRGDTAANAITTNLRFNNDSAANYGSEILNASGTTPSSAEQLASTLARIGRCPAASAPASSFAMTVVEVPFYASTAFHKNGRASTTSREATTSTNQSIELEGFTWFGTPVAINRIQILPASGNFAAGSRVMVYGEA
jgi:hypothetical protein